jgi:hypothetical protein
MEDEKKMDEIQDEVVADEAVEEHAEGDEGKWAKVFADIEGLRQQVNEAYAIIDDHRKWMEEFVNGTGGALKDSPEEVKTTDEDELDDVDDKFYQAMKENSYGGVY